MTRRLSALHIFTAVSLLLVLLSALATGFAQSRFFTQAILQREGALLRDFAAALLHEQLADGVERQPDWNALAPLAGFAEAVKTAAFDRDGHLVWSVAEEPQPGWSQPNAAVRRALAGEIVAVFHPPGTFLLAGSSSEAIIEFYLPLVVEGLPGSASRIVGAVEFYRLAHGLELTLDDGRHLVWVVVGAAGLALYIALFALFWIVYRRKQEAESALSDLSSRHGAIVQMEKLSAVGRMIGEVAHQLNNPLVGVINLAQLAKRQAPSGSALAQRLDEIEAAGEHCRDYVARILSFTKLAHSRPQPVDLRVIAEEAVALATRSLPAPARIELTSVPGPAPATADPVLLRHALFNLLVNAHQHGASDEPIRVVLDKDGSGWWCLSVLDSGPGIAAAAQPQLFTPFFTTRPDGVGLGLAVVKHVAEEHGGTVEAVSRPEGGARFTLRVRAA